MRYALGAICLMAICLASLAEAANENFTVVLHARTPSGVGACTVAGLPTCDIAVPPTDPTTQIDAGIDFRLFIFVNNYTQVQGFQTAFNWPADWLVDPDGEPPIVFGCRANQLNASEPTNPGGPTLGAIATAFDCFAGPGLATIARIDFMAGASGCLTQINPTQGTGMIEVIDCQNQSSFIDANDPTQLPRLGTICIGTPGINACSPLAVEPATWGGIKASYR